VDGLPERERKTVLIALWLSGTSAARDVLAANGRKVLLQGTNYYKFDTSREPPSLDMINPYWGFLDIQWGRFFASGSERPLRNILSVVERGQTTEPSDPRPSFQDVWLSESAF